MTTPSQADPDVPTLTQSRHGVFEVHAPATATLAEVAKAFEGTPGAGPLDRALFLMEKSGDDWFVVRHLGG